MKNNICFVLAIFSVMLILSANAAVKNTRTSTIYDKIYLAVMAAEPDDTLLVVRGFYTNDWIPMDHKSLTIKGNYSDDFSVQYEMDTVKTIVNAGQNYAAWAVGCTSYFEYIRLTSGEHGLIANDSLITCKHCFVEYNTNSTHGAGILAYNNSTIVLYTSRIWDNIVTGSGGKGGGAYISNNCSLVMIMDSSMLRNEAENGGGVYIDNAELDMGFQSSIYGCKAAENGGGVFMLNSTLNMRPGSDIGASHCIPTNIAETGHGGGVYARDSTVIFTNDTELAASVAGQFGGGIYARNCNLYFYNSVVGSTDPAHANSAGQLGGGVFARGGRVFIDNTEFINNSAGNNGGAIRICLGADCDIKNSLFQNNSSDVDGGAVALYQSTVTVNDTYFYYNTADDDGGGIYAYEGFLRLINCDLDNNSADNDGSGYGDGGALCVKNAQAVLVAGGSVDSMLTNSAVNGGGIFVGNNGALNCSATDNYFNIVYNSASENGGGICVQDNSTVNSTGGVRFANNGATSGGGAYVSDNSIFKMYNSGYIYFPAFYQNGAIANGGGLALSNAAEFAGVNCLISENDAQNNGGGIYANASTVSVLASFSMLYPSPPCRMNNNIAFNYGGAFFGFNSSYFRLDGGEVISNTALNYAGGLEAFSSSMDIYNTLIIGNTAPDCGGVASVFGSRAGLFFCTIAGNATNAVDTGSFAGGVVTLTNCIVWNNAGTSLAGSGTKNVGYSDIEGGYTGAGNINVNPDFGVNYRLMESSPCIDTGIFIGVTYDCVGNTRPYGDNVDMGAYEFIPEPLLFEICHLTFVIYYLRRRRSL